MGAYGPDIYEHIEANLHSDAFQFLGKLEPLICVLRRAWPAVGDGSQSMASLHLGRPKCVLAVSGGAWGDGVGTFRKEDLLEVWFPRG